jgi:hypothetical protein
VLQADKDESPDAEGTPPEPREDAGSPGSSPWWRREGAVFVEIFALAGFALTQPVLDLFGRNPTQFVFRDARPSDIVQFALCFAVFVPLVLWAVEAAVGFVSVGARRVAHLVIVAGLVWVFAVQAGRSLVSGWPLMVLAAAVAALGTVLVTRAAAARLWLRFAAVAPIAFVALFLFASDTAPLVTGGDIDTVGSEVGSPAPVVMLVLDELPLSAVMRSDGSIDGELYPNLAELAGTSTFFRNTTTVSSSTGYAVPAIVTGELPEDGTVPVAADHPENLFTLLGESYPMHVTESITRLCPTDLCEVRSGAYGFRSLVRDAVEVMQRRLSLSGKSGDLTAGLVEGEVVVEEGSEDNAFADFALNQPGRFREFLDGMDDESAALHYLHILLPHMPYRYLPSGARYQPPTPDLGTVEDNWADHEWFPTLARQRMQLQLAYVDELVGTMVSTLRRHGTYDDALVVLTADHGVSFHAGGPIRAIEGQTLAEPTLGELAWVPLIVKEPGQRQGSISDANVVTVDILPTIADVLDIDIPWEIDGVSALGEGRDDDAKPFHGADVNDFGVESLDRIQIDPEAGRRSVSDAAVDRFLSEGTGVERFWRVGPEADLVGTDVGDAGLTRVDATLRDAGRYDLSDDAATVPALVRLRVADDLSGEQLVVAVNDVVGAVAPAVSTDGVTEVAVMVDDALFRAGRNEVTLHRLAG